MPDTVLARVTLHQGTLLPKDDINMDFVINGAIPGGGQPVDVDEGTISAELIELFNGTAGNTHTPVARYLSPLMDRTPLASRIDYYNLEGALDPTVDLGSPYQGSNWTLGDAEPGFVGVPSEVAVVLTHYAEGRLVAPVEGGGVPASRPKQRRTGRTYLGPLNTSMLVTNGGAIRLDQGKLDNIGLALNHFKNQLWGDGMAWCIWSRVDQAVRAVTGGHIDDAPDTRRSRGVEALARRSWGFQA